jgi:hypothetical protein
MTEIITEPIVAPSEESSEQSSRAAGASELCCERSYEPEVSTAQAQPKKKARGRPKLSVEQKNINKTKKANEVSSACANQAQQNLDTSIAQVSSACPKGGQGPHALQAQPVDMERAVLEYVRSVRQSQREARATRFQQFLPQ